MTQQEQIAYEMRRFGRPMCSVETEPAKEGGDGRIVDPNVVRHLDRQYSGCRSCGQSRPDEVDG